MNRMLTRAVAVAIAAAVVGACASDDTAVRATSPTPAPGTDAVLGDGSLATAVSPPGSAAPVVVAGSGEDARLLTYAIALGGTYQVSRDEAVAFLSENVAESEIESCMNEAGFEYIPEQSAEEQVASDLRYSVSPEEYAATYGLGIVGWDLGVIPPLEPPRNQTAEWSMTESEREAYNASLGQCRGVWDPERRAWSDAINVAMEQFRPVVDTDPRMTAGLADWRACMSSSGFEFHSPMQMREGFYARMNANRTETLETIFADEVRVAVANVSCEAAYDTVRREVITDRLPELKAIFDAALASSAAPEAQG